MLPRPNERILTHLVSIACCLTASCGFNQSVSTDDLLTAENNEEFNRYAELAKKEGTEGIPLLLAAIDDSLQSKYDVESYGRLNTALAHLHDLATEGTYTVESVPVLIEAIQNQISIADTLTTAKTLQIITGVDPGYDEAFVRNYTPQDEGSRQRMISAWRSWYMSRTDSGQAEMRVKGAP